MSCYRTLSTILKVLLLSNVCKLTFWNPLHAEQSVRTLKCSPEARKWWWSFKAKDTARTSKSYVEYRCFRLITAMLDSGLKCSGRTLIEIVNSSKTFSEIWVFRIMKRTLPLENLSNFSKFQLWVHEMDRITRKLVRSLISGFLENSSKRKHLVKDGWVFQY